MYMLLMKFSVYLFSFSQVLERSIELQDDDSMLKTFIDLGDHCPKFLRSQLEVILELMLKVGGEWVRFCNHVAVICDCFLGDG